MMKMKFAAAAMALASSVAMAQTPKTEKVEISGDRLMTCGAVVDFSQRKNITSFEKSRADAALQYFLVEGEKSLGTEGYLKKSIRTSFSIAESYAAGKDDIVKRAKDMLVLGNFAENCMKIYENRPK